MSTPARVQSLTSLDAGTPVDRHMPRSVLHDSRGRLARDIPPRDLVEALADPATRLWVDIDSESRHQHAVLEKLFRFHPLTIEDTLNPNSRVKIEAYDGYLFVVLRAVRFRDTTTDPYDLETENLYIYLGPNYVVTVHSGISQTVEDVADLLRRSPDLIDRGPARLAHTICDNAIDAYFPVLDRVDDFIDGLEARVFERFDESALRDIFALKRTVLSLRRYLAPQREIFNVLTNRPSPLLPAEAQLYFRDVYDHVLRINDSLDNYRELLSSTLDSYLTQVNNRLGSITKGLSVIATLSVPFVVVSGMWGMNFRVIPLSGDPQGFWFMLVLQLAIGIGLVALLRWKRFL
ncbi:MAG: corA [Geminicoccaceae bacterium]|nr:corA [Geminicoccaceae bacterium]